MNEIRVDIQDICFVFSTDFLPKYPMNNNKTKLIIKSTNIFKYTLSKFN